MLLMQPIQIYRELLFLDLLLCINLREDTLMSPYFQKNDYGY